MHVTKYAVIALALIIESGIATAAGDDDAITINETRVVATRGGTVGEIKAEINNAAAGKGYGGLSGVMAGAASGGPIGAVVGAVAGMFAGGAVHNAAADSTVKKPEDDGDVRNSRRTYIVHTEDGEDIRVRSPNKVFSIGDKVEIVRGRLYALN